MMIWVPLSLYVFYLPYKILLTNEGRAGVFYALSLLTFVFFFMWCIADFADANGFVQVKKYYDASKGGAGTFGLFTSILNLAISVLTVINVYMYYKSS